MKKVKERSKVEKGENRKKNLEKTKSVKNKESENLKEKFDWALEYYQRNQLIWMFEAIFISYFLFIVSYVIKNYLKENSYGFFVYFVLVVILVFLPFSILNFVVKIYLKYSKKKSKNLIISRCLKITFKYLKIFYYLILVFGVFFLFFYFWNI